MRTFGGLLMMKAQNLQLERMLDRLFRAMGIRRTQAGAIYLAAAIRIAVERPLSFMKGMTAWLYPALAERYATSPAKVERAIRRVLDGSYALGRLSAVSELLGLEYFRPAYRPSNREFIAIAAEKISAIAGA